MSARAIVARLVLACLAVGALSAQVTVDRLLQSDQEPQNWLTYSGNYKGWRHSPLKQITPANAKDLEMKWVFQADSTEKLEASPLVVDGVMYVRSRERHCRTIRRSIFWMGSGSPDASLRPRQSRPGDSRQHVVHGHDRAHPSRWTRRTAG
jgi:hypothetical protein